MSQDIPDDSFDMPDFGQENFTFADYEFRSTTTGIERINSTDIDRDNPFGGVRTYRSSVHTECVELKPNGRRRQSTWERADDVANVTVDFDRISIIFTDETEEKPEDMPLHQEFREMLGFRRHSRNIGHVVATHLLFDSTKRTVTIDQNGQRQAEIKFPAPTEYNMDNKTPGQLYFEMKIENIGYRVIYTRNDLGQYEFKLVVEDEIELKQIPNPHKISIFYGAMFMLSRTADFYLEHVARKIMSSKQ